MLVRAVAWRRSLQPSRSGGGKGGGKAAARAAPRAPAAVVSAIVDALSVYASQHHDAGAPMRWGAIGSDKGAIGRR